MILRDRERGASQLEAEYRERLYSVAFALCHDATEAEDLVFRTIERVIDKIETYEERDSFYDWMCVILQNLYRDSCRSKMVRGTMPVGGPAEVEPFAQTVDADTVVEAVDAEIARRALEKIPPQMREVLILHSFMDMSVQQIARTLMVAPGTVMSRLYHARRALAQRLGANLKKPAVAMIAAGLLLIGATAAVVIDAVIDRGSDSEAMVGRVAPSAQETIEVRDVFVASSKDPAAPSVSHVSSADNLQQTAISQQPSTSNQLENARGENKMNIKRKVATALAAATLTAMPVASGAVLSGDAAAERIVLSNRVVLVYRTGGTLKVDKSGMVDVLVIGGGGGGGANSTNFGGGGGGAGGVVYAKSLAVNASDEPYAVTVGDGGVAGTTSVNATAGGDSSVFGLVAYGGGAGAKYGGNAGGDGASGGGGTATNGNPDVPYSGGQSIHGDQGNDGGAAAENRFGCGGGGGAGYVGGNGDAGTPGVGGDGVVCDIAGTNVWYGGGGAGFRKGYTISGGLGGGGSCVKTSSSASTATPGTDGLGGGGCGGANGGSGVVIVSFELNDGLVDTEDFTLIGGDYTIPFLEETALVFTNSGTLTVTGDGMVEVLAVGGGGGGGRGHTSNLNYGGGGGGGGGVAHFAALPVTAGTYDIVVGAGGDVDANGGDTKALGVIAFGGGAGAQYDSRSLSVDPAGMKGRDGASGGGTCHAAWYPPTGTFDAENLDAVAGGSAVYELYGNAGNYGGASVHQYNPGGGGGAGAPGSDGSSVSPGAGGDGKPVSITGAEVYYGGGGAGARYNTAAYPSAVGGLGGGGAIGENGVDGLGGGGSGNRRGGSGVVIIRYHKKPVYEESFDGATGGVMTRRSGHRIHTFAADGTFTMPCVGKVEVLLVGGGGGGGANVGSYGGAGGGGGGVIHTNTVLTAGEYRISVGDGGVVGASGGLTSAFGLMAYGGGFGASSSEGSNPTDVVGTSGGGGASGGGSTHTRYGPSEAMPGGGAIYAAKGNRGNAGGAASHVFGPGGGGGADETGETVSGTTPGRGGSGYVCDVSGGAVSYGGGGAGYRSNVMLSGGAGGGGACNGNGTGEPGTDGLGGGGCGGYRGGSGVVIVRYRLPPVGTVISIH